MKLDHRDVQLTYFRDGPGAVADLIDKGLVSRFTVRRALRAVQEENGTSGFDALAKVLLERGISLEQRPSKNKPEPGDVRKYRVQHAKGSLFIRLPVWHLGVKPGQEVEARFYVNSVKVEIRSGGDFA